MNKLHSIHFVYEHMVIGGAEGLILRLSNALRKNGFDSTVWTFGCESAYSDEVNSGDIRLFTHGYREIESHLKNVIKAGMQSVGLVAFNFASFSALNMLSRKYDAVSVVLYVVHTDIIAGNRSILAPLYKRAAVEAAKSNQIVFMDEETRHKSAVYCACESMERCPIARIAIDTPKPNEMIACKSNQHAFNILTVSRADFPFKGYLYGLVDIIRNWSFESEEIALTIISYGSGVDQLKEYARGLENVQFVGKVTYSNLWSYYKRADLYIGMGTTVIEAASQGTPALAVRSYTRSVEAPGLFSDFPTYLGGTASFDTISVDSLIRHCASLSNEELRTLGVESHNAFNEHYSLEETVSRLVEVVIQADSSKSFAGSLIGILKCKQIWIKKRIRKCR